MTKDQCTATAESAEVSVLDAFGDDAVESVSARLSPHPQTCAYDCGSGGERRDPVRASGGGAAPSVVQS